MSIRASTYAFLLGSCLKVRHDINEKFYGLDCDVQKLLDGTMPAPPAALPLYEKLAEFKEAARRATIAAAAAPKEARAGPMIDSNTLMLLLLLS